MDGMDAYYASADYAHNRLKKKNDDYPSALSPAEIARLSKGHADTVVIGGPIGRWANFLWRARRRTAATWSGLGETKRAFAIAAFVALCMLLSLATLLHRQGIDLFASIAESLSGESAPSSVPQRHDHNTCGSVVTFSPSAGFGGHDDSCTALGGMTRNMCAATLELSECTAATFRGDECWLHSRASDDFWTDGREGVGDAMLFVKLVDELDDCDGRL